MKELFIDMEKRMQQYRLLTNELTIKKSDMDSLIKLYEYKNDELLKKEKTFKKDAVEEAELFLKNANSTIENAIKKIREEQASKEVIRHAREQIKAEKERIDQEKSKLKKNNSTFESTAKSLTKVAIGQDVFWQTYRSNGIVLSNPDSSGKVLIQAGKVKMKVPLNELYPAKTSASKAVHKSRINIKTKLSSLKTSEIDIRGFTVEEGIDVVDKFLDEAIMSGLEQVYIIHGKGTGKLRKGIYRFLEKHPRVKSKAYPEWNLGDTGMTVVHLQ